jgi:hypothetical protein
MTDSVDPPPRAEVSNLLRPRSPNTGAQQQRPVARHAQPYAALLEREIARVIGKQEAVGLRVVTDGELGRSSRFGSFFEAIDGFSLARAHFAFKGCRGGHAFAWPTSAAERPICRGPILLPAYTRARRLASAGAQGSRSKTCYCAASTRRPKSSLLSGSGCRRNADLPALAGDNELSEDEHWAKPELVVATAERAFGAR